MTLQARYTGEYGYDIILTADTDLSTASSVLLKARIGDVVKSLTCTIVSNVATARVTQNFFDIAGIWELQLQAQFATAKRYQRGTLEIEIKKGIE